VAIVAAKDRNEVKSELTSLGLVDLKDKFMAADALASAREPSSLIVSM
jgi:hypothetical protein